MLVTDFVNGRCGFDVNANVTVYDCRGENASWDDAPVLARYSCGNLIEGSASELEGMSIGYMTTDLGNGDIVIEVNE